MRGALRLRRLEMAPALRRDAAGGDRLGRQPRRGIVGAQPKPIFGARGEHAIGLGNALEDEVVDHHADIGIGAVEEDRRRALAQAAALSPATRPCAAASS